MTSEQTACNNTRHKAKVVGKTEGKELTKIKKKKKRTWRRESLG